MRRTKDDDIKELYQQEQVAELYEETRFTSLLGKLMHNLEVNITNSVLAKKKPKKLLEIATGTGRITRRLEGFEKAIGIDSSEAMLKQTKKNLQDSRWKLQKGDALNLSFKENTFDTVVTYRLIRHFVKDYRDQSYAEILRVLKPGGILIFDVLNKKRGFMGWLADLGTSLFAKAQGFKIKVHDEYFTRGQIIRELKAAGFEVVTLHPVLVKYPKWAFLTVVQKLPGMRKTISSKYPKAMREEQRLQSRKTNTPFSWVVVVRKP